MSDAASAPNSPRKIAVIGGGVSGLCSAYYLSKTGAEVTVIDSRSPQDPSCSTGNNGMVVPSHFVPLAAPGMVAKGIKMMLNRRSPFFIRPRASWDLARWCLTFMGNSTAAHVEKCAATLRDLNLESRKLFLEIAEDDSNDFNLQKRGLFMICSTQQGLDAEAQTAAQARELGLDVEVIDSAGLHALEPHIEINAVGAAHYRDDCHLAPENFLEKLRIHLETAGVNFLWNSSVNGFTTSANTITGVSVDGKTLQADHVVLTAGIWSKQLAKKLGINLMMQSGKGYSLTLDNPVALPNHCAILSEKKVAVTPMGTRLRFGGTMEIGGKKDIIDPLRLQGIIDSIPAVFPQFTPRDFEDIKPWNGLRPCSPDGMPYLGYSQKWDNLVVATGHSMMGLSMGPATGKIVTDFVTGGPTARALTGCEVDRY